MRLRGIRRTVAVIILMLSAAYLLLLIPARSGNEVALRSTLVARQAFAWNQDDYCNALETTFQKLRQDGCRDAEANAKLMLGGLRKLLHLNDH